MIRIRATPKEVKAYPPGTTVSGTKPGDFFLIEQPGFVHWAIRTGQRCRFHGKSKGYAHWNHAGVFLENGDIVEARPSGVRVANITEYDSKEYVVVNIHASDEDRDEMLTFALSQVGDRYGFLTIISLLFSLITGSSFAFGLSGTDICSGLVAETLTRGPYIMAKEPFQIMPADLGQMFNVIESL